MQARRLPTWIMLLALLLGACGGDAGPQESSGDVTQAGEGFPAGIEHRHGSTSIPDSPQRVISVGFTDHDFLLALGVKPLAVREWFGERPFAAWPWAQESLGNSEPQVLAAEEINYERIAGLRPHLIVGVYSGLTEEEYRKLSEIAPTVAQPKNHPDFGVPWQEQARILGRAVGRGDRAEELVEEVEGRFKSVKSEHPEFEGKSAAIGYSFEPGSFGIYGASDPRSRAMLALGFQIPDEIETLAGDEFSAEISAEQLGLLDADVLVWVLTIPTDAVTGNPVYAQLDVAEQGRDVFLDGELAAAFSFSSPLSLNYLLDRLPPQLAAALDGDPGTPVSPGAST